MILHGEVVSVKDNIYLPRTFAQEDETAGALPCGL